MKKGYFARKTLAVILAGATALQSSALSFAEGSDVLRIFNTSSNDGTELDVINIVETGTSEYGLQSVKYFTQDGEEVDIDFSVNSSDMQMYGASLPSSYNLKSVNRDTGVRDQGSYNVCWTFAATSSMESNAIINGIGNLNTDYSERHIAWFTNGTSPAATDPTYGDCIELGTNAYDFGGSIYDAVSTLAKWAGAENESAVPYSVTTALAESYRYHSYAHLQNADFYDPSDITAIKQAIYNGGALWWGYTHIGSNYNSAKCSYYAATTPTDTERSYYGHAVSVVGWDDNYSKDNFNTSAPANGAWILKNNWGTSWGNDGYFYMSYYDCSADGAAAYNVEPTSNYGDIYQWDGNVENIIGINCWSNVFTARETTTLDAISFMTASTNTSYTIKVYTNVTNSPDSGTLATTQTATIANAGYHTVDLTKDITITKGQKFSVVLTSSSPIYIITDSHNYGSGTSYYFNNVNWVDLNDAGYGNICIKAFTKGAVSAPTGVKASAGDAKVQVKWNAVNGASSYRVMVWDGSAWTGYNTTATSYMVRNLTNGKKYAFAVKAYGNGAYSESSATVYATPYSSVPTGVKAGAGDAKVQVKWNAVTGATSYRVMVWDGSAWTGYSTTATSYIVRNLTNGKKYAFVVKAYVNGAYSENSATVYATPYSIVPSGVKAGAGDAKVQVKWNAVTGATSYRVMVWDGSKWTGYSTTATSYMVRSLTNNKTYAFAVKAYVNGAYSDTSATVYAVPHNATSIIPTGVKAGGGDSKVQVKWNTVYGASSYRVMVWDGSKWTGYNTTSTSYIVRNLTNGKKYAFVVKAYINGAYSANSTTVYATPNA